MSKFEEKYAQQDTVEIALEDVIFHVILPTSANRKFERAAASCALERNQNTGLFEPRNIELDDIFTIQHTAFLKSCVVKVDGLDFDPDEFIKKYPDAAEDLYDRAIGLAEQAEKEAAESVGKSQVSSIGQPSGEERRDSIMALPDQVG